MYYHEGFVLGKVFTEEGLHLNTVFKEIGAVKTLK